MFFGIVERSLVTKSSNCVKASIIFVILNYSTHPPSALMVKDNAVKARRTSKCRLKMKKLKPPDSNQNHFP